VVRSSRPFTSRAATTSRSDASDTCDTPAAAQCQPLLSWLLYGCCWHLPQRRQCAKPRNMQAQACPSMRNTLPHAYANHSRPIEKTKPQCMRHIHSKLAAAVSPS
jgi:hypothetical protein